VLGHERAQALVGGALGGAAAGGAGPSEHGLPRAGDGRERLVLEPSALPAGSQARPLLVVLHGHASNPSAASDLAAAIDPDGSFVHVAPEGPVDLGEGDFAWFDDEPGSLGACRRLVRALLDGLAADGGGVPIVVIGYSQGGAAAIAALTEPGAARIDGIVGLAVLSGFVAEARDVEQDLEQLGGLRVLVQHGRGDDVVPEFFAQDLAAALAATGSGATTDWRDMGHEWTADSVAVVGEWARPLAGVEV